MMFQVKEKLKSQWKKINKLSISNKGKEEVLYAKNEQLHNKKIIKDVVDVISKSKTGNILIKEAKKNKYKFEVCPGIKTMANLKVNRKEVTLNANLGFEDMLSSMIFGLAYAKQHNNASFTDIKKDTFKTRVMTSRACQADASALRAQTFWELREAGLENYWNKLLEKKEPEVLAFQEAVEKKQENKKNGNALTASFLAWYENTPRIEKNEELDCVEKYLDFSRRGKSHQLGFSRSLDSKDVLSKVCRLNNRCYFKGDLDILNKKKYLGVKPSTKDTMKLLSNAISTDFLYRKSDNSYLDIPLVSRLNISDNKLLKNTMFQKNR